MVGEFPELQGVMGGHYLRLEDADDALWSAVRDHYLPVGFDGPVPDSVIGRLLGVADRLDTVAGLFAVGERSSGSKDPFGLRRAAQGAVKIVAESGWDLDLAQAVDAAAAAVAEHSEGDREELAAAVTAFIADRVRRWLTDVVEVSGDTADAVMAAGWSDLPGAVARAEALETVRSSSVQGAATGSGQRLELRGRGLRHPAARGDGGRRGRAAAADGAGPGRARMTRGTK